MDKVEVARLSVLHLGEIDVVARVVSEVHLRKVDVVADAVTR
jgi:hypothetical protein